MPAVFLGAVTCLAALSVFFAWAQWGLVLLLGTYAGFVLCASVITGLVMWFVDDDHATHAWLAPSVGTGGAIVSGGVRF